MKGGSLEWFNIQYWMAIHDRDLAVGIVPLDAALASFGDINRGKWPGVFAPQSATLFSYVMNNYWHTNYRAGEGGVFTFRYAMTSAPALNGNALTRLAMEEMRPAELNDVVSQDKVGNPERPLPAQGKSFLEIPGDDVALITWKRAEDGNGSIFRLQETAGTAAETYLTLPGQRIRTASLCSGVEDDLEHLPVENDRVPLRFKPFEVLTVRIVPE
jgi:alpha-mannosidase